MRGIAQQLPLRAKYFLEPFSHFVECARQIRDFIAAAAHGGDDTLGKIASRDMLGGAPQPFERKGQVAAEQQANQRTYQGCDSHGKRNNPRDAAKP